MRCSSPAGRSCSLTCGPSHAAYTGPQPRRWPATPPKACAMRWRWGQGKRAAPLNVQLMCGACAKRGLQRLTANIRCNTPLRDVWTSDSPAPVAVPTRTAPPQQSASSGAKARPIPGATPCDVLQLGRRGSTTWRWGRAPLCPPWAGERPPSGCKPYRAPGSPPRDALTDPDGQPASFDASLAKIFRDPNRKNCEMKCKFGSKFSPNPRNLAVRTLS